MDLRTVVEKWRPAHTVGIDFGASHFKVIELLRGKERLHLGSYGMAEALGEGDEETAIRRIRVFLREHGLKLGKVVTNIDDETLRIRRMDLPKMPDRDMKVAIRWNFRELVDVPLEKYVVSYTHIPVKPHEERFPYMAFGVAAEAVARAQGRLRKLGMRAAAVEPTATALLAAFDHAVGWHPGERYALIDLGFHTTHFLVMGDEALLFSRLLSGVTGERLLRVIGREGTVSPEEARLQLRAACGGAAVSEGTTRAFEEFYTQILVEIQRSMDGFSSLYHIEEGVRRLFICGGGSRLPNLVPHLAKNLGVSAELLNPFTNIADAHGTIPAPVEQGVCYAVAVGLALPQRRRGKEGVSEEAQ